MNNKIQNNSFSIVQLLVSMSWCFELRHSRLKFPFSQPSKKKKYKKTKPQYSITLKCIVLEIKERYYLTFSWNLHKIILLKEVAEMRCWPSYYIETNLVIYGLFDTIRQMVFAHCPQNAIAQLSLLVILASLQCS